MKNKKLLMENSPTPIYQRIINGFSKAFENSGYKVIKVNPRSFSSPLEYVSFVKNSKIDFCLMTNQSSYLTSYIQNEDCFLFELIPSQLVFVHHDNLVTPGMNFEQIGKKFNAFLKTKMRSTHFCLEKYNLLDLREMGIPCVYPITHASEFAKVESHNEFIYDVAFLGHILPPNPNIFSKQKLAPLLQSDYRKRVENLDHKIEPTAVYLADQIVPGRTNKLDWFVAKYFYFSTIHSFSQFWRGEIISKTGNIGIDIVGGDPAYLHEVQRRV